MNEKDLLKVKQSLKKIIQDVVIEETKPCFRVYKAMVKNAPNGSTCGVQIIGDNSIINLPYSDLVKNAKVNDFVWVATLYDSFSNAIVFSTVDFNFNLEDVATNIATNILKNNITAILLEKVYPVGSVYSSIQNKSPASFLGGGWEQISGGKVLQTTTGNADQYLSAGLPNIYGKMLGVAVWNADAANCTPNYDTTNMFKSAYENSSDNNGGGQAYATIELDASRISNIYGKSTTVQPPAYTVYAWKRVL
jgi:hypothetical protein